MPVEEFGLKIGRALEEPSPASTFSMSLPVERLRLGSSGPGSRSSPRGKASSLGSMKVIGGGRRQASIEYTEVVVIGNGPSGLSLSYMLAGNWPYYSGSPHPNSYLQMRLEDNLTKSIIQQDLEYLSSGLEGRSSMPLALLFDSLTHPDADMGAEHPSLLQWRKHPDKAIEHVVLGKHAAGGAWQMMEGQMQTLSLGNWMQLPNMPFKEWLAEYRKSQQEQQQGEASFGSSTCPQNRATMADVRSYYEDYVKRHQLVKYQRQGYTVTSVERILDVCHSIDEECGEQNPCSNSGNHEGKFKWEVRGYHTQQNDVGETMFQDFCYRAPNVVLATGTYDLPNHLGVPGEHLPYIMHSMPELEMAIKDKEVDCDSDPVLVVGAGLSAADAILMAQAYNINIIHVFRRDVEDPNIILRKLPPKLYPEYHQVHQMMKDQQESGTEYRSYPMHSIKEFKQDGQVLLRHARGSGDAVVQVSRVLVLIGSRPDLSFLPQDGTNLGSMPGMCIDSKHNPIEVDPFSYQVYNAPGMFAMGPLIGDNFVRFLRGGALGITAHLSKKCEGKL